jgi:hypothetical protein
MLRRDAPLMARAVECPQYTPESCQEAASLRSYCEGKFPVGAQTFTHKSITGQSYSQFSIGGYLTAEEARVGAQECFDKYADGKSGTLYWRVAPEIAYHPRHKAYAFYMRLLISDKPRKS